MKIFFVNKERYLCIYEHSGAQMNTQLRDSSENHIGVHLI